MTVKTKIERTEGLLQSLIALLKKQKNPIYTDLDKLLKGKRFNAHKVRIFVECELQSAADPNEYNDLYLYLLDHAYDRRVQLEIMIGCLIASNDSSDHAQARLLQDYINDGMRGNQKILDLAKVHGLYYWEAVLMYLERETRDNQTDYNAKRRANLTTRQSKIFGFNITWPFGGD